MSDDYKIEDLIQRVLDNPDLANELFNKSDSDERFYRVVINQKDEEIKKLKELVDGLSKKCGLLVIELAKQTKLLKE